MPTGNFNCSLTQKPTSSCPFSLTKAKDWSLSKAYESYRNANPTLDKDALYNIRETLTKIVDKSDRVTFHCECGKVACPLGARSEKVTLIYTRRIQSFDIEHGV